MGNTSLKLQYPNLYNLAYHKHDTVHKGLSTTLLNFSFRRNLQGDNLRDWLQVVSKVADVELVQGRHIGIWTLQQNGLFSVHSMYLALMDDNILPINRSLWKLKIPLKGKVFIWLLHHGVILTKDNLAKQNWQGTIAHLFFDCHIVRLLWCIIHITFGL